ncbi:amidohydrolase family protein [Streptomyces sp. NRRL S-813]|uniref:amidohydrolase family protein n=1 Tax=Streptomyces sp. NRRL S-813 TaxID=1463919 RepID=UPI0004C1282F|nr:amidohydrolase family protein [Streptomyces sp. NRRL S-813]
MHDLTTGGDRGYLRIATEEAFATSELLATYRRLLDSGDVDDPGFTSLWGFYAGDSPRARLLRERLVDLGERRLADMDATGIDHAILSLTSPGVQILDTARATALATHANDVLAEACRRHPDRYTGLTAIAPQDPEKAAAEITRGHRDLGFRGVIVNSHTHGAYLDDRRFEPILAAAEDLDTPLYLHPSTPSKGLIGPLLEAGLDGAIYGFAVETGMHLLRLITSGVFDRHPRLRVVVGHLGEAIPFWLPRIDFMHAASVKAGRYAAMKPLQLKPSEYLRRNVWVTTSGMAWQPAIRFVHEVLGADRVMYAMDYPYQYVADEVRHQDELPFSSGDLRAFFQTNAEQVFGLKPSA